MKDIKSLLQKKAAPTALFGEQQQNRISGLIINRKIKNDKWQNIPDYCLT